MFRLEFLLLGGVDDTGLADADIAVAGSGAADARTRLLDARQILDVAVAFHLEAVDLLTHRDGISYEDYVKKIVSSGNQTAIRVKLNDLHHNLWRAEDALNTLDTSSRERAELLEEILRIAKVHDRAERYIRGAVSQ